MDHAAPGPLFAAAYELVDRAAAACTDLNVRAGVAVQSGHAIDRISTDWGQVTSIFNEVRAIEPFKLDCSAPARRDMALRCRGPSTSSHQRR